MDWIQKPVDPLRLERAMKSALRCTIRPRILHIEDDPDIVQVTRMLRDNTADIAHVASIKEARQLLAGHTHDLVILDLALSDGSGVELLDELKGRCPVVIFSAQKPGREITVKVTAALTKSLTSNQQLPTTSKTTLGIQEGSLKSARP